MVSQATEHAQTISVLRVRPTGFATVEGHGLPVEMRMSWPAVADWVQRFRQLE